jgi:hypothetical protein
MPAHLHALVPNFYFMDPPNLSADSPLVHGVVFMALRDLSNEELFLNYNFNLGNASIWPIWYNASENLK